MRSLSRFVTGRRTKWLVLAGWLILAVAMSPLGSKLSDATDDSTESALPSNAQSKAVLTSLQKDFPSGQTANALIIYQRKGGLTAADRAKILSDARGAERVLPLREKPTLPFGPGGTVSDDGQLAYTTLAVPNDEKKLADWGKDLRDVTGGGENGLNVWVSGD